MVSVNQLKTDLLTGKYTDKLCWLYGCDKDQAAPFARRYAEAMEGLDAQFGSHTHMSLFSAPGRTAIGGNHTDHQHGCVLAGSVNIDMIAAVAPNGLQCVRLKSEGYEPIEVALSDLHKRMEEENTSSAILRGTCEAYASRGGKLFGLDIYVASNVPKGSGVSSSAAFEVLLGTIFNELCMGENKVSPIAIAQIGQWVENVYFGKPCGLMDQMASSVGGVVGIDFADPSRPVVEQIGLDLADAGLALCILDSGADHADLTDEYAAVPNECKAVAAFCGGKVLRDVPYDVFMSKLSQCRREFGDRAVLRAIHFYSDNARVPQQIAALKNKDYAAFLALINESGHSSWECLQNITPVGAVKQQAVAVTITLAKQILAGRGAVRVHGGGFAGTVQAFVPLDLVAEFKEKTEAVLGQGACNVMVIRPAGGIRIA